MKKKKKDDTIRNIAIGAGLVYLAKKWWDKNKNNGKPHVVPVDNQIDRNR